MFTGIIEDTGIVEEMKGLESGLRLRIATALAPTLAQGASIAVNGVCLTVVVIDGEHLLFDVGPETVRVTTLGQLQRGQAVNLERPMTANGRLDGHFVQGHVDAVGTVSEVRAEAGSQWLTVEFPPLLAPHFIRKGSVAVDGISLTVAGLGDREFDVQVIPYTWDHTNLRHLRRGDKVNIECDMIGKYVVRAMEARRP